MRVQVRVFGVYAFATGVKEAAVDLPPGATFHDLLIELCRRWPRLAALIGDAADAGAALHKVTPIVNGAIVDLATPLEEGDEAQVISPVAGG